jgi:neutral ceramidase
LITGVVYDGAGFGRSFGQVTKDVLSTYTRGAMVSATFVGANPRNNLRLEGTFAAVEKQSSDGSWVQVKNDEDWELVYQWKRVNGLTGTSDVTISWDTALTAPEMGTYKFKYYGDAKAVGGSITDFEGESAPFRLT